MSSIRIYAPLSTPIEIGKDKLDELCASVYFLNNKVDNVGIYVYLHPIKREGNISSSYISANIVEGGFSCFVKSLKTKSEEQIELVADEIDIILDDFAYIWGNENFESIIRNRIEKLFNK